MNERQEICQACLSYKRLLSPLGKLKSFLFDVEEWGLNIASGGGVCWECKNLILNFHNFKIRVCRAQNILASAETVYHLKCLSTMGTITKSLVDHNYCHYDSSEGHPEQAVSILVKQEMIDQYAYDNPGLNIEVGSPRTERVNDVERSFDENLKGSISSMQVIPTNTEQNTETGSQCNTHVAHTRSEPWSLPELINSVDPEILNIIKMEHEEINTNTPLELVSEEVQVKDEPLSEGDYNHTDIYMDSTEKSFQEEISGNFEGTRSDFFGCGNELLNESKKQQKQWENAVLLVHKSICSHKYGSRFMRQISDKVAPKYSKVVKRPMDLTSIKKRVKAGIIRTTAEFHRDIMLMLVNAIMYNSDADKWHQMAKEMTREVNSQIEMLKAAQAHAHALNVISPENQKIKKSSMRTRANTLCIERKRRKSEKSQTTCEVTVKNELNFTLPLKPQEISKTRNITATKTKCAAIRTKQERKSTVKKTCSAAIKRRKSRLNSRVAKAKGQVKMNSRVSEAKPQVKTKVERSLSVVIEPLPKSYISEPNTSESQMIDVIIDEPKTSIKLDPTLAKISQFTKADLSVAVTTIPQRDLTKDQANVIKKALEDNILILAMNPTTTFAPTFREKPVIADGVIKLWCEDEQSFKWLRNAVRCLKSPWPDVRLVVIKQCDLPQKIKSALLLPDCNVGIDVIHRLLRVQNPWAEVGSWALYSAEKKGDDMFLVLGIPSTVIPILMKRERRLNFSLGALTLSFFKGGKLCDVPPGID